MLLVIGGCADGDLFNPNRSATTQLSFRPHFAVNANASALIDINQVRLTIHQMPGGELVGEQVIPVDPGATTYDLNIDVPAPSDLRIRIELLNTVAGVSTVQFSNEITLSVGAGPQPNTPLDIPVFPGGLENLSITGLTVAPRDRTIIEGETFRFTASTTGGPPSPMIHWVSQSPSVATVAADGTITGVSPGSAIISASAGLHSDAVRIDVGPRATTIEITPAAPAPIGPGNAITFAGRVIGSNGQALPGLPVTWTAADPTIAVQIEPGVFRALRVGTTTITATATQGTRTITGTVPLTVEQRPLTVLVSPRFLFLRALGETASFVATAMNSDNVEISGLPVSWTSSDPSIASVDAQGVVTAHRNGTAIIRANVLGFTGEAEATVSQTATSVTVAPSEHTLEALGQSVKLSAEGKDAQGNPVDVRIEWSSSNPNVATVDAEGVVKAVGDGFAVITADAATAKALATIRVERVARSIQVTPAEVKVAPGGSFPVSAVALDANRHPMPAQVITWSSADPSVATVDANGVVRGVAVGNTTVTAVAGGVTQSIPVLVVAAGGGSGGGDLVVLNDVNVFDDSAIGNGLTNNEQFFKNLFGFAGTGPRAAGSVVWFDRGRNSNCGHCVGVSALTAVLNEIGLSIVNVATSSGTLVNIPASVKAIILWNPNVNYTVDELNALKQFAAEGGRIIFVGEHGSFYSGFVLENAFLRDMGSNMRVHGAFVDCGYVNLPASSMRPHPITDGVGRITIACSSVLTLAEGDAALYVDDGVGADEYFNGTANIRCNQSCVLGAVTRVDTTPIVRGRPLVNILEVQARKERRVVDRPRVMVPNPRSSTGY